MKEVNASIITIGDELLIGQTVDTNSSFIARELNKIGIWVKRRIAVGDVKLDIHHVLEKESSECDVIIITGGLGPTADDITKPALCEYFGSEIVINEDVLENVKNIFLRLNRPLIERNLRQAEVPHNCIVLPNARGTAPGMWFEKDKVVYVSLPGVPYEMMGLIEAAVLPKLQERFELPVIVHRTLYTIGQGESMIAEVLTEFENSLPEHVKLAYLPNYGAVKLRLTSKGSSGPTLNRELDALFKEMSNLVSEWVVADEDISLQEIVFRLLQKRGATLGTAESCTGGYIAHLLTSLPGSSSIFKGGIVSYANEVKEDVLNVAHETLLDKGAVSEATAREMAAGALKQLKTDYVIATSGIMGPGGGTMEKPVGLVWIAVGDHNNIEASKHHFRFDRRRNIELTANQALNLLRKFILQTPG